LLIWSIYFLCECNALWYVSRWLLVTKARCWGCFYQWLVRTWYCSCFFLKDKKAHCCCCFEMNEMKGKNQIQSSVKIRVSLRWRKRCTQIEREAQWRHSKGVGRKACGENESDTNGGRRSVWWMDRLLWGEDWRGEAFSCEGGIRRGLHLTVSLRGITAS